ERCPQLGEEDVLTRRVNARGHAAPHHPESAVVGLLAAESRRAARQRPEAIDPPGVERISETGPQAPAGEPEPGRLVLLAPPAAALDLVQGAPELAEQARVPLVARDSDRLLQALPQSLGVLRKAAAAAEDRPD